MKISLNMLTCYKIIVGLSIVAATSMITIMTPFLEFTLINQLTVYSSTIIKLLLTFGIIMMLLNKDNYEKVLKLEVEKSRSRLVAPNIRSLADCYYYREDGDVFPVAIQDNDEVVGFVLLDLDENEK